MDEKEQEKRRCVFCERELISGHPNLQPSKEHIFRLKTLNALGLKQSQMKLQVFWPNKEARYIRPVGNTFVTSGVCSQCNRGFNPIDDAAETTLVDLAKGSRRIEHLTDDEHMALAIRTAKMSYAAAAMAGQVTDGVEPRHFRSFHRHKTLPENSAVVLMDPRAMLEEVDTPLGHSFNGFWDIDTVWRKGEYLFGPRLVQPRGGRPGYKIGFRLGQLTIAYVHVTDPDFRILLPPYAHVVATTASVRHTLNVYYPNRPDLPLTSLNSFMCGINCRHKEWKEPPKKEGQPEIVFLEVGPDGIKPLVG